MTKTNKLTNIQFLVTRKYY